MKLFFIIFLVCLNLQAYLWKKDLSFNDERHLFFDLGTSYTSLKNFSYLKQKQVYDFYDDKSLSLFGKAHLNYPFFLSEKDLFLFQIDSIFSFSANPSLRHTDPFYSRLGFSYQKTLSESQIQISPYYETYLMDYDKDKEIDYLYGSVGLQSSFLKKYMNLEASYTLDFSQNNYIGSEFIGAKDKNSYLIDLMIQHTYKSLDQIQQFTNLISFSSNTSQGELFYYKRQAFELHYKRYFPLLELDLRSHFSRINFQKTKGTDYLFELSLHLLKKFEYFYLNTAFLYFSYFSKDPKKDKSGLNTYLSFQFQRKF